MKSSIATVLVTGANGFIGSHLVARLAQQGVPVRAFVRDPGRFPPHLAANPRVQVCQGDVTDREAVGRAVAGCDAVIHAAALQPFSPLASLAEFARVNVGGTQALMRALKQAGGSCFLLVSTINVHGLPPPPRADAESPLRYSGDRYSDSKIDAERAAWDLARELDLSLTVIRPACTFGPGSKAWTVQPLERIRRGVPVLIGRGSGLCNPVYIENLVDLILAALSSDAGRGQAFIGSDGIGVEWREFFGYYARLCGRPLRAIPYLPAWLLGQASAVVERFTGRPGLLSRSSLAFYTHRVVFDTAKNARLLGHTPKISFEEGMRRTGAWLRAERII